MATIKSFSDLEQSKKLAEILPIESADIHWSKDFDGSWFVDLAEYTSVKIPKYVDKVEEHLLPCWSLAALLEVLPHPTLYRQKDGAWGLDVWIEQVKPYSVKNAICGIDACYEMILKLYELKIL